MLEAYVAHILESVGKQKLELQRQWATATPVRHIVIDKVLPAGEVESIDAAFPRVEEMRLLNSLRERKYTSKNMDSFDSKIRDIASAFQDPRVISLISDIMGILDNQGDPEFYAGGISSMVYGNFLNPHIDNSHDGGRDRYRTCNLLFYTSPNWAKDFGGNLELWDQGVRSNITITSQSNRLVVIETNPRSWHSVSPLTVRRRRNCVSNYYFSHRSPEGREYFHITGFSARPEQPFRRAVMALDRLLRTAIRRLVPAGLGKKDVYKG